MMMTRLTRLAAVLPIAAAAVLSVAGTASASTAGAQATCDGNYSFGRQHITVSCPTSVVGTQFRAMALCPNGDWHFGPFVLQGPGHVSVATCASDMLLWDWDLQ